MIEKVFLLQGGAEVLIEANDSLSSSETKRLGKHFISGVKAFVEHVGSSVAEFEDGPDEFELTVNAGISTGGKLLITKGNGNTNITIRMKWIKSENLNIHNLP